MRKEKSEIKFLITGGHLTPALATIDELRQRGYNHFFWIGRVRTMSGDQESSAEFDVVHIKRNLPFYEITTGKLVRFSTLSTFFECVINLIRIPIGFIQSFILLGKLKPDMILSFGGYIALPIVISARIKGIKSITHEQTVVKGLANSLISRFVDRIFVSWNETLSDFNPLKVLFTGNPVRKEIFIHVTEKFPINTSLPTIYLTGGNQGAHILNTTFFPLIPALLEKYNIIHQTGKTTITQDYEKAIQLKSQLGRTNGCYFPEGTIYGQEIGEVFHKTDLVISRAGANTITELLALGKLSILIPIPWSIHNEQYKNAQLLEKIGLGLIIEEKDLTKTRLVSSIETGINLLSKHIDFHGRDIEITRSLGKKEIVPNASEIIADEIEKLIYMSL